MAQLYKNRYKNAESHLFGDEPPPEHYEISPETIQGLRDANNNRRKAMESNLFSSENNTNQISPSPDNRNIESQNQQKQPQNQQQFAQNQQQYTQYQNTKYQYSNQTAKSRYQQPHFPSQISLKPKLQPLSPAPSQDGLSPNPNPNQSLLQQFKQTQDQLSQKPQIPTIDYSSIPNLNENLSQIDNSLPQVSARKFLIENKSQQNLENIQSQQPPRTPHRPTFLDLQVKEAQLPNFKVTDLVQNGQVPQLSPFPNLEFDLSPIDSNFSFAVNPLTSSGQRYPKKLNLTNSTRNEMKKIREELEKDSQQFDSRIKRIEKVEIVQPMRPITPVSTDPPRLDFSFATPRSMWNINRRQNEAAFDAGRRSNRSDANNIDSGRGNGFRMNNYDDAYEGDADGYGENPGLMSTQSDFIYMDQQNLD